MLEYIGSSDRDNTHLEFNVPVPTINNNWRRMLFEQVEAKQIGGFTMSEQKKETNQEEVVTEKEQTMEDLLPQHTEPLVTMKRLAAAGVQYGHQTRRWNPKMAPYIYGAHNGIYIIDLKQTVTAIEIAYATLKEIVEKGGKVIFVGTKKQVQEIIKEEALRSGSFYVNNRWLGGTLTNFRTILSRIRYLRELEQQEADGTFSLMSKKEVSAIRKTMEKLSRNLEGIKDIKRLPQAVFVADPTVDHIAVAEARKLKIPVFGIIDTNTDPGIVDYLIPGNDDAIGSVKTIVQLMADAVVEAKGGLPIIAYKPDDDIPERGSKRDEETFAKDKDNIEEEDNKPAKVVKAKTTRSDKPEVEEKIPVIDKDIDEKIDAVEKEESKVAKPKTIKKPKIVDEEKEVLKEEKPKKPATKPSKKQTSKEEKEEE
jgi:small subunit ribosomal protein S2